MSSSGLSSVLLVQADARALPLPDNSIDSIVCDPPYSLSFMGKGWDRHTSPLAFQQWCQAWGEEALHVLKPGGHLVAFGGTRTYHRLVCGLEDAGFEIRDSLHWMYSTGFPKGGDVGKAIDRIRDWTLVERLAGEIRRARAEAGWSLAEIGRVMQEATSGQYGVWYHRGGHMFFETGRALPSRPEWERLRRVLPIRDEFASVYEAAERAVVGHSTNGQGRGWAEAGLAGYKAEFDLTAPATPDAVRWSGWSPTLKPAHEPIVLCRKPFRGSLAANVLAYGTGALHVDACRVGPAVDTRRPNGKGESGFPHSDDAWVCHTPTADQAESGRWPPNLLLSHSPGCVQSGTRQVRGDKGSTRGGRESTEAWRMHHDIGQPIGYADPDGLETVPAWQCEPGCVVAELDRQSGTLKDGVANPNSPHQGYDGQGGASRFYPQLNWDPGLDVPFLYQAKASRRERNQGLPDGGRNGHATVKPVALMRWLIRLVTPPGGIVLDPFCGSGTTGVAARLEGVACVCADDGSEPEALRAARYRLGLATPEAVKPEPAAEPEEDPGQLRLL